ncbi:MAG: hypothetical protein HAW67_07975, partial [Endozoicomonadaceae bacterium]|nr:hypothetical protein [Endozoicomonadaceae bacterium]
DDNFTGDFEVQDKQTGAAVISDSAFVQQQFIKKHINNLRQEFAQLSSNTDLLGQKLDGFSKQQKQRNQWLVILIILIVIGVAVLVGLMLIQRGNLIPHVNDIATNFKKNGTEGQNNFEQLQQKLLAMQSEQQQIKAINMRLQNSVVELNKQLKQVQGQSTDFTPLVSVDQAQKSNLDTHSNSVPPKPTQWIVSLESFPKQLDARQKALEYIAQGIPVIVSPRNVNGVVKFGIFVEGFQNKQESLIYAQKIKKRLNLESAWIGRVK